MRFMIEVRAPLEIKADPQGGWELTFWVLDNFNYTTPFRAMLGEISEALGQDPNSALSLPAYIAEEDFVEGALLFNEASLRVYYEHALSYLTLANADHEVLTAAVERIQPRITVL